MDAGRRTGGLVLVDAILAGLLAGTAATVVWLTGAPAGDQRLAAEADRARQTATDAQTRLRTELSAADLRGRLEEIRALSAEARRQDATFATLADAMGRCYAAVADYNALAGRFPPELLAGLPARIDLADPDTDCRAGIL